MGEQAWGPPSPAKPLPCASWRAAPTETPRLPGGGLSPGLLVPPLEQGWEALFTVSRGGGSTQLKLDSGIFRAPASVCPSIRRGEGCCQHARAGRSLDVSLRPPQGSLALIFSHPPLAFGQRLLSLAWPCGHLLISSDFKGRAPPHLIPILSPWDSSPLPSSRPLFPSSPLLSWPFPLLGP